MKTKALTFSAMCIVLNVVVGSIMQAINIPLLFLDTFGTIMGAIILGPLYGAIIGGGTNLVLGIILGPINFPFALVNIALGLLVGFVSKKWKFNYITAMLTGVVLAILCPLIGTPISIAVSGGLSGSGADLLVGFLRQSGESIFQSAFLGRIASNIVDKPASCILAVFLVSRLPKQYLNELKKAEA
ncbi:CD3073 family putative ECF transporter S component [Metaclostridioides mangenotii]|uniref:CD3073 family putative ECF transporter S component n=1 Tax=Metaclostridioides mangenotii TaxID=1540 RepID=UPI0028E8DA14|nr:CD3073 family putative ECF transporter S component [Clostridioides mangenotii]